MSSTRNLAASNAFTQPIMVYQPVAIQGDDPALTAANLIKQTILGAPFEWPYNSSEIEVATITKQQDYTIIAPDFGYLSRIDLADPQGNIKEIAVKTSLPRESAVQRPASAAIQNDDNQGNLTVRFNTLPDQVYTAVLQYQRKAVPMTSLASTWAPIPDQHSYIFDWGYLSILALLTKDPRMPQFRQMFLSNLLGAQDALDATQRNIFLGNWLDMTAEVQRNQQKVAQAGRIG